MIINTIELGQDYIYTFNDIIRTILKIKRQEELLVNEKKRDEWIAMLLGYKPESYKNNIGPGKLKISKRAKDLLKLEVGRIEKELQFTENDDEKDVQKLGELFRRFEENFESALRELRLKGRKSAIRSGGINDPFNGVYEDPTVLQRFQHTVWNCYERKKSGFGRKLIRFGAIENGALETEIVHEDEEKIPNVWAGTTWCKTTKNFLIIVATINNAYYAHFMINLNNNTVNMGDVYVGHMTYNHLQRENVVTKLIVIHKTTTPDALPGRVRLSDNHINNFMPDEVRRFLMEKNKSRLPSPSSEKIFFLKDLKKFVDDQKRDIVDSFLIGKYEVSYKYSVSLNEIKKDRMCISRDIYGKLVMTYEYFTMEDEIVTFTGEVNICTTARILSAYLFDRLESKYDMPDRTAIPMMLMASDIRMTGAFNLFAANITGYRDEEKGIVSRLVIISRLDSQDEPVIKIEDELLHTFFNVFRHKSKVRPPKILSAIDMKKAINDELDEISSATGNNSRP